jgi:SAM-dependent methyltransferase
MKPDSPAGLPEFDQYAKSYDAALAEGLSVSGEDKTYFAQGRAAWLAKCLRDFPPPIRSVLDFGCGTGSSTPFLLEHLQPSLLVGVDVSAQSIAEARRSQSAARASFHLVEDYQPGAAIDLAFCNGVFHHISPAKRAAAVSYVFRSLRRAGRFAFWENNPWNPGTRWVMSRIPFDRDAVTLVPPESRRLLRSGGFEILRTDFLFIFPRALRWFRRWEPSLAQWPIGAQYQVLCRKP